MKIFAIDYETFYSKDYSVRDLGNYGYTHHPEFDAYLLSVAGEDFEWVGNPKDFDWSILKGALILAHNAGFEYAVSKRLLELGIITWDIDDHVLMDTADLAAYCGYPRSLAAASEHMLKVKLDKAPRDKAKGKKWRDMTPEFQSNMKHYALGDAKNELKLWLIWNHMWPEWERELSIETRKMCWRGVPVDIEKVDEAISKLQILLWKVRSQIPWTNDPDAKTLSPKLAAEECRKHGVTPPKSMAKDSEEFAEWLRQHGDDLPFARAMGSYRSINGFLKKLEVMKLRTKTDGFMPIGLKYAGAHTLRDSGDAGFNVQNLPRDPMFEDELKNFLNEESEGIDVRGMIVAPPGYILSVCDLRAIEPCCTASLSGDEEMVKLLKAGMDPYEASARATSGYTDPRPLEEVDPEQRKYEKVKVLGCGYGAGAEKVQIIAKTLVGLELTLQQAAAIVASVRGRKFIPKLWYRLERAMRRSVGQTFEMELPSGRVMRYRDVRDYGGLSALTPRLGQMLRQKYWGGTLMENLIQSSARDVFMWHILQIIHEGLPPILRVHDEAVGLHKIENAEAELKTIEQIMSTPPDWWLDLPVSAKGYLCQKYEKR